MEVEGLGGMWEQGLKQHEQLSFICETCGVVDSCNHQLSVNTKVRLFNTNMKAVLLHGEEARRTISHHTYEGASFHQLSEQECWHQLPVEDIMQR